MSKMAATSIFLAYHSWSAEIYKWRSPNLADDMPDREKFMIIEAWKQADFLCKGYILSVLEDDLYNVYSSIKTSKKVVGCTWEEI